MSSIFTSSNLPTTITPNPVPSANWQNPNNILLIDGEFASASGPSNILEVGTFNLNVPVGATVLGITLQIKGYRGVTPVNLSIYAVDDTTGVAYAYPLSPAFSGFNGVNNLYTLSATLFGTTWSADQINNIKFRLIADNPLYLDGILAQVEYVPAVTPVTPPAPIGIVGDEFVEAQPFAFAQSLDAVSTFLFLETFNYPDRTPIQFADFHTVNEAYIVLDQGIPGKEEVCRIKNVEQNYGGSGLCRISFVSLSNRGLGFQYPYASVGSLIVTHDSTALAVLSNPAIFYRRFLKLANIGYLVSAPIEVDREGVQVLKPTTKFNFKGSGVNVTADGTDPNMVDIQIDGTAAIPPVIVNTNSASSGSVAVSSIQFDLDFAGVNRGCLIQIGTQQTVTVSSVTIGGVAATQKISETDVAHNLRTEEWFLLAPALGVHTVVITLSDPALITAGGVALQAVNQSTPTGASSLASGNSTTPSTTLSTTADFSIVFDALCAAPGVPSTYVLGAGQSLLWEHVAGSNLRQGASSYLPAGSSPDVVTNHYIINPSTPWALVSLEILGVPPVPPVISSLRVQDESAGVVVPNTSKIVVPTGHLSSPTAGESDISFQNVEQQVSQTTHGLALNDVIKSSGTDGQYARALADDAANAEAVGIVTELIDANTFVFVFAGIAILSALPMGTVAGNVLYLDPTTAGLLTLTAPVAAGKVSKPMCVVLNASTKQVLVYQYRGIINQ
jgi:hypothetical protein